MTELNQAKAECCGVGDNLVLDKSADTTTCFIKEYRCKVCGRLHRRMTIKPIEINTRQPSK